LLRVSLAQADDNGGIFHDELRKRGGEELSRLSY
jgi:hypothetical protein